jgi:hypothetical protein
MADEILWPLRAVSKDPTNVTKLDADNNILTSTTDLDGRYVNVAGDAMTGSLGVQVGATFTAPATATNPGTVLHVVREGGSAIIETYNTNAGVNGLYLRRKQGTIAAPTPANAGQSMGVVRWQTKPNNGSADRTTAQIQVTAVSAETQDGFYDGAMDMILVGAVAGQASSFFQLRNLAATGTTATVSANTFVCAADNFRVDTLGYIVSKGGLRVERAQNGDCLRILQSNILDGQGGTAIYAACTGAGTVSGAVSTVTGLDTDVTGTYTVGVGVTGKASGTASGANFGLRAFATGGARNIGIYIDSGVVKAADSYALQSVSPASSYFAGSIGIGWANPTNQLEVSGTTMLRGTLEVTGNITSSGTAHSFAANSIPTPAVVGSAAFTPANAAAAGVSGSIRWDENFLYVRTGTAWKRVALTSL